MVAIIVNLEMYTKEVRHKETSLKWWPYYIRPRSAKINQDQSIWTMINQDNQDQTSSPEINQDQLRSTKINQDQPSSTKITQYQLRFKLRSTKIN